MTRVVLIDTVDDAIDFTNEWDSLPTAGSSTVFTSSSWAIAAWRHLSDLGAPCLVVGLDGPTVVAVLPLTDTGQGLTWAGAPLGDEHDVRLVASARTEPVVTAMVDAVVNRIGRRNHAVLQDCSPGGVLAGVLSHRGGCPAPVLPISDPDPVFGSMARIPGWSRRRRRGLRSARRHLESQATLAFEWIDEPEQVRLGARQLVRDRLAAWAERRRLDDLPPMDRHPAFPAFLAEASAGLARQGGAIVVRLRLDGDAIAQSLFFKVPNGLHWYTSTYREDMARFSPSHLLLAEVAERAGNGGATIVDLGRGDEPYKFDLGAVERHMVDVTVAAHP